MPNVPSFLCSFEGMLAIAQSSVCYAHGGGCFLDLCSNVSRKHIQMWQGAQEVPSYLEAVKPPVMSYGEPHLTVNSPVPKMLDLLLGETFLLPTSAM